MTRGQGKPCGAMDSVGSRRASRRRIEHNIYYQTLRRGTEQVGLCALPSRLPAPLSLYTLLPDTTLRGSERPLTPCSVQSVVPQACWPCHSTGRSILAYSRGTRCGISWARLGSLPCGCSTTCISMSSTKCGVDIHRSRENNPPPARQEPRPTDAGPDAGPHAWSQTVTGSPSC